MSVVRSGGGGPTLHAFPMGNPEQGGNDGMTLRDWFAGQALVGLLARRANVHMMGENAARAFQAADAMLAARKDGVS